MSVNIEKRCDLCGKIVDIVEGVPEDDKLGNYTTIVLEISKKNPKFRRSYASRGSLLVCKSCTIKVYNMSINKVLNMMVDAVDREDS